mmetsp:Transcript_8470/g.25314  ORF Transcript_8470/g.25314 Transcript_8470/m.25314 type:complete len:340 (+) Transcript_8470:619-1638(+)
MGSMRRVGSASCRPSDGARGSRSKRIATSSTPGAGASGSAKTPLVRTRASSAMTRLPLASRSVAARPDTMPKRLKSLGGTRAYALATSLVASGWPCVVSSTTATRSRPRIDQVPARPLLLPLARCFIARSESTSNAICAPTSGSGSAKRDAKAARRSSPQPLAVLTASSLTRTMTTGRRLAVLSRLTPLDSNCLALVSSCDSSLPKGGFPVGTRPAGASSGFPPRGDGLSVSTNASTGSGAESASSKRRRSGVAKLRRRPRDDGSLAMFKTSSAASDRFMLSWLGMRSDDSGAARPTNDRHRTSTRFGKGHGRPSDRFGAHLPYSRRTTLSAMRRLNFR